jgi:riboflavin synthase
MFTGIIDHTGSVLAFKKQPSGAILTVSTQFSSLCLGESIAVNGVCLTVVQAVDHSVTFQLSPETLALTQLAIIKVGDSVNLERALKAQDYMGGHCVTGHVDGVITLKSKALDGDYLRFDFAFNEPESRSLVIKKGSVAINGVSLTINSVDANGFSVMCVPHTLSITQLDSLQIGDGVNVEWDQLAKLIKHQVQWYLQSSELSQTTGGVAS